MSNAILMRPETLTRGAFKEFGDVIEASDESNHFTINSGYTERYHQLANVDVQGDHGHAIINIFRSTPLPLSEELSLTINMMERHPIGSQAFIPLGDEPYLVVVAPPGEFDINKLKVFIAKANQGVNYATGTWHHFCLALNKQSEFLVVDRAGAGDNCDELTLEPNITIVLDNTTLHSHDKRSS